MSNPLLTIVIANYNYGRFLESALRSVIEQDDFDKCELIVIDGGSTDNSIETIEKYADEITWWVSEPDKGQSDAFNKGFSRAKGAWLTWLNADDVMMPKSVIRLEKAIQKCPTCKWFSSGTVWMLPDGKPFRCVRARPFSNFLLRHGHIPVWGPSSFFMRDVFNRTSGFRVDYHYMMDTDLWFRFYYEQALRYEIFPGYVWGLRVHPAAKTSGYRFKDSEMNDRHSAGRVAQRMESDDMRSRYPVRKIHMLDRIIHFGYLIRLQELLDLMQMKLRIRVTM